jgi:hypothetical protein
MLGDIIADSRATSLGIRRGQFEKHQIPASPFLGGQFEKDQIPATPFFRDEFAPDSPLQR